MLLRNSTLKKTSGAKIALIVDQEHDRDGRER